MPKPDQDLRGLGQWTLYAKPREWNSNMIDLMGRSLTCGIHQFYTSYKLIDAGIGAQVRIHSNSPEEAGKFITIGDFGQVMDPVTGQWRVNLCIGDYSKICNLRIIENDDSKLVNKCPSAKLQLTVFDVMGFIQDKINFLINE